MNKHVEKEVKCLQDWIEGVKEYEDVCDELDKIQSEVSFPMSVNLYRVCANVNFSVGEVTDIPIVVRRLYKSFGKAVHRTIDEKAGEFAFSFGDYSKEHPRIDVNFIFTGDSCKMVQVGTETKEVPIMELQCNGKEVTNFKLKGDKENE